MNGLEDQNARESNMAGVRNISEGHESCAGERSNNADSEPAPIDNTTNKKVGKIVQSRNTKRSSSVEQYDINWRKPWAESPGAFRMEEGSRGKRQVWSLNINDASESLSAVSGAPSEHSGTSLSVLIAAEIVNDAILVEARPDSWWRRNLWWLGTVSVSIMFGIIIAIVVISLTGSELPGSDIPTISPTTWQEGVQESVYNIIVERFPQATVPLSSESSPQSKAVKWISEKKVSDTASSWYTNQRILQQFALLSLFLSTSEDSTTADPSVWSNAESWMESSDECEWQGVTCGHDTPTVIAINLKNNNLSGSLPSEFSILSPSLLSLSISNNNLKGSIPVEVGTLTKLTTLDLSANAFSGSIPKNLGDAEGLEFLDLSRNTLSSTIPVEIGLLTQLQHINVGHNRLIGSIPSQIGMLRMAEEINFENNELSYALPKEIQFLISLKKLHLAGNQLLGPLPSEMGSLRQLEVVDLSRNYVFANIPLSFWNDGGLPSLKHLDLSNNLLTGSLPRDFGGSWQQLTSLRLGGRNFLDGPLSENSSRFSFLYLPLLEELDLSSNHFVGTLPSSLFEVSTLKSLDLSGNEFNGAISPELSNLRGLQFFDISGNIALDGTLSPSIGKLSNLKTLGLSGISGSIPNEFWSLTELESLALVDSKLSGAFPPELALLTSLKDLAVSGNALLQGSIPSEIGTLPLENLELSGNPGLDGIIPSELGLLPLTSLVISENGSLEGTIPTELGVLPLTHMDISENYSLGGPIPSELGSIENLSLLNLAGNDLTGSIPTYVGNLISLKSFRIFTNRLTGTIPTEIGLLTNIEKLLIGANILIGTIPSEIGKLVKVEEVSLRWNQLTGTIPSELENLRSLGSLNLYSLTISGSLPSELCSLIPQPEILLDCAEVVCKCCGCPEYFPSAAPSIQPYPSTRTTVPSAVRASPTQHPTFSSAPSMPSSALFEAMEAATRNHTCFPFTPISKFGNLLTSYDEEDEALVPLPFPFDFNDEGFNYTSILVGKSGRIKMGNDSKSCFIAVMPARSFDTSHGKDFTGPIYTAVMAGSFVISWEDVIPLSGSEGNYVVSFQAALHADGRVEFRWGDGAYPVTHRPLATVANTCTQQYASPTGYPFLDSYGQIRFPEYGAWPDNQCRLFQPDEESGFYKEVEP